MDNYAHSEAEFGAEPDEIFISVDVETAGPNPSDYSLLSIGACVVADPAQGFYVELRPAHSKADPAALAVGGLSLEYLTEHGFAPEDAMAAFEQWVALQVPVGRRAVFVAFNAPFDWMFVNDYFFRFLGRNPFGHSALDVKAFYMGMAGVTWSRTSMRWLAPRYLGGRPLTHNALQDARDQAELFRSLLAEMQARGQSQAR